MNKNGIFAIAFHICFIVFIVLPLLVIILISFTNKGYISFDLSDLIIALVLCDF